MNQWNNSVDPAVDTDFEGRLIEAVQPIRGLALAQGIHHLFLSGIHQVLENGPASAEAVAEQLGMLPDRVAGFFRYLAVEGIVSYKDAVASLTVKGHGLKPFRPWYELLVGGYAQTFGQITETLSKDAFATRNGLMVGLGSCGISQFDALPLVRRLLTDMPVEATQLVDIGCGSGDFLIDLARDYPGVQAIGVDPHAPVERSGEALEFRQASAVDYVRALKSDAAEDGSHRLFVAGFLLQEILEQQGRDTVVEMVRTIVGSGAHLAVVEVDHRPADPAVMNHGLGRAYYNPYYFLHVLTEQRLETREFWLDLFAEARAEVVSCRTVNPQVDSTGLEFGCLLKAK